MRLKDEVVLITGGSRGRRRRSRPRCRPRRRARRPGRKDHRPAPQAAGYARRGVPTEVRALGSEALVIQAEHSLPEQVTAMVDKTVEHFGKIDALINNAGAIFWGTTTEFPVKRYDLVMDVNVEGAFLASQAAIPTCGSAADTSS